VLATFPITAGVADTHRIFDVTSLLVVVLTAAGSSTVAQRSQAGRTDASRTHP
jgi:hypothetical protein